VRLRFLLLTAGPAVLVAGVIWAGCGGSTAPERAPPDVQNIPTATLPNPMPEVVILDGVPAQVNGTRYTVVAGDSPANIAEKFDTTAEAIMEANRITDPTGLYVGQVLVIPKGSDPEEEMAEATPVQTPEQEEAAPAQQVASGGECTHVVESGDVADLIATALGITVDDLAVLNGATVDDLRSLEVGDVLIVPCPGASAATPAP